MQLVEWASSHTNRQVWSASLIGFMGCDSTTPGLPDSEWNGIGVLEATKLIDGNTMIATYCNHRIS